MNYKKLDFNISIGSTSFRSMLTNEQIAKSAKGRISLQSKQIKALIAEIYTYGLFYPQEREDRRPDLLSEISKDQIKLLKYVKQFSHHLLNNLDIGASSDFKELLGLKFDIRNPLKNDELLDFVTFYLMDETYALRYAEFGKYMMDKIMEKEMNDNTLKLIKIGFEISDLGYGDQFYKVAEEIDRSLVLNNVDKLFICGMIRNKVRPRELSIGDYIKFGRLMQYHAKDISTKLKKINNGMSILKQERIYKRNNNRGKGRKL